MPSIYFQQIYNRLVEFLGTLPPGTQLPPVFRIAKEFGVSRTLVYNALERARECGVVSADNTVPQRSRKPTASAGTFVLQSSASTQRERVQEHFLGMIRSGTLRPGQSFTEAEIARATNSAIITVREALLGLSHSRLISKQARRHWRVVPLTPERIAWATEARLLVECHALKQLFDAPDDRPVWQELRELQTRHRAFRTSKSERFEEFYELDREFHRALYRATANEYLCSFEEVMSFVVLLQSQGAKHHPKILHTACVDHLKILEATLKRDRTAAIALLRDHLIRSAAAITESIGEPSADDL